MKKVIIITGPTAVGKTKLSIEVAKNFQMPLINGDAYQIYKHLDILTAKPTKEEMENVHHYLMDELDPKTSFSIYDYQKLVRNLIEKIELPIIVGGSGLYIDSVIYDYRFSENNEYKFNDEGLTNEEIHNIITELDPENAKKIHPNNRKRVIRAIELAKTQNSEERNQNHNLIYDPLIICLSLEREVLYNRINQRVLKMIENGLIEEVQQDRDKIGFQASKAIGFNDVCNYLDGIISKDEMIDNIQKASRHYAKRQLTWYRNHPNTLIVDVNLDNYDETIKNMHMTPAHSIDEALKIAKAKLGKNDVKIVAIPDGVSVIVQK